MVFAPFLILFECTHIIFYLVEFSRSLRFLIVGFTTFKANFQVWTNFWIPSTLFFQNKLSNLSPAKNTAINLHFSCMYARFCDFFQRKNKSVLPTFSLILAEISTFTSQSFHHRKVWYLSFRTHFQPYP